MRTLARAATNLLGNAAKHSRPGQTVEAHGGRVGVEDAPGGGALLRLELPPMPSSHRAVR